MRWRWLKRPRAMQSARGIALRWWSPRRPRAQRLSQQAHGGKPRASSATPNGYSINMTRNIPLLFTGRGYQYCDLIISQGRPAEARDRATQTVEIARRNNWILFIALDTLTLGRAHRGLALLRPASGPSPEPASVDVDAASARFDEAVAGLRGAGQNGHVARGLIARAAFRRSIGDWGGAARDLDEAHEFAEPGPMRLFLCDIALERARLALARREAFAPLSGLAGAQPAARFA